MGPRLSHGLAQLFKRRAAPCKPSARAHATCGEQPGPPTRPSADLFSPLPSACPPFSTTVCKLTPLTLKPTVCLLTHLVFPLLEPPLAKMGRMHNPHKGIAGSALPYKRSAPRWLKVSADEIQDQIFKASPS